MLHNGNNSSGCPGKDVILELLRAEHEQVKRRTDIIKQLIMFNCSAKTDSGRSHVKNSHSSNNQLSNSRTDNVTKSDLLSRLGALNRQVHPPSSIPLFSIDQSSGNNWESRHINCFLDTVNNPKPNRNTINASYSRLNKETTNIFRDKPKVPNHSAMQHDNAKGKGKLPNYSSIQSDNSKTQNTTTYSQFQRQAQLHSTPKKVLTPTMNSLKPVLKNKPNTMINTKQTTTAPDYLSHIANQTEENSMFQYNTPSSVGYDYKLETHKLIQEVSDLKNASKRYEDEKSDWINEKRRQIRILQELRDASCDETKAAMKLTSWKASDIECNRTQYEESKRTWLICKKNQIELLERLRGVSLSEIKRGIERISNSDMKGLDYDMDNNRCKSMMDFIPLSQRCGQELYNSEKISVRLCGPDLDSECLDKDKININIMMKSNSNISSFPSSSTDFFRTNNKGGPSQFKKLLMDDYNLINFNNQDGKLTDQLCSTESIGAMTTNDVHGSQLKKISGNSNECVRLKESIMEMKRNLENNIGTTLFHNTYNILTQLNCPQLILKSAEGEINEAENVYNYILEERKVNKSSLIK